MGDLTLRSMVYTTLMSCAIVLAAAPALAADVPFVGPSGWSHVDTPPSTDPAKKVDQWHIAGDVASVTFLSDANGSYADALAAIEANFKTNGIKPATDKDMPCQGKTGHVVEFAFGPDGHRVVVNRLLVPNGNGVVTITYFRSDGIRIRPRREEGRIDLLRRFVLIT